MKQRHEFIAYSKALALYLAEDIAGFKKMFAGGELEPTEKKILQARISNREHRWDEAIEALSKLTPQDTFLAAECNFVLATSYEYRGLFQKSALHNERARTQYAQCQDKFGSFNSTYNLSIAFSRLGLEDLSLHYLLESEKLTTSEERHSLVHRELAFVYLRRGDQNKSFEHLDILMKRLHLQGETDRRISLTIASDLFFRLGFKEKSFAILTELKSIYSNREKSRVYFEYYALEALLEKKALGTKPQCLQDSPEYSLKWDILTLLQGGQTAEAEAKWDELVKLLPQRHLRGFKSMNASDDKSVFMSYLNTLRSCASRSSVINFDLSTIKSNKARLLFQRLRDAQTPVRKEELIEHIWGVPYDPSLDARFYKLIERVRGSIPHKIVNQNNAYQFSA